MEEEMEAPLFAEVLLDDPSRHLDRPITNQVPVRKKVALIPSAFSVSRFFATAPAAVFPSSKVRASIPPFDVPFTITGANGPVAIGLGVAVGSAVGLAVGFGVAVGVAVVIAVGTTVGVGGGGVGVVFVAVQAGNSNPNTNIVAMINRTIPDEAFARFFKFSTYPDPAANRLAALR
jgi:hypothetical protein